MARIRSIKPEFWTSEQVLSCSRDARLFFIGLWNFVDDSGVHPLQIKNFLIKIFPADEDVDETAIRRMLVELHDAKLIEIFKANDVIYLKVTGWRHQKIDRPSFKFPKSGSTIARLPFDERHPPEGEKDRGKEGSKDHSFLDSRGSTASLKARLEPTDNRVEVVMQDGTILKINPYGICDHVWSPPGSPDVALTTDEAIALRNKTIAGHRPDVSSPQST